MHWSSSPEHRHAFTAHERERRWNRKRQGIAERHIDLLVVLPQWLADDALHVANQFGAVVFPLDGEPTLIVGGEGSNRASPKTAGSRIDAAPRWAVLPALRMAMPSPIG